MSMYISVVIYILLAIYLFISIYCTDLFSLFDDMIIIITSIMVCNNVFLSSLQVQDWKFIDVVSVDQTLIGLSNNFLLELSFLFRYAIQFLYIHKACNQISFWIALASCVYAYTFSALSFQLQPLLLKSTSKSFLSLPPIN